MQQLMIKLMLSCKIATALMEQQQERPLTLQEKFQLYVHKGLCDGCKAYQQQSLLIEQLLHQAANHNEFRTAETHILSQGVKEKILRSIKEKNS